MQNLLRFCLSFPFRMDMQQSGVNSPLPSTSRSKYPHHLLPLSPFPLFPTTVALANLGKLPSN
ncbi:unnamed protein product [Nezara viridula]|uniref:Uncharacterized protein n=1 Tax=Nezara viridula TaxID=85310 RepID=A0A9P0E988_NEZVI|nr:unnamed protein product [Nezara viridula]